MKNSNDTIGNRTRDLLTCSAVPQPTAPPRALGCYGTQGKIAFSKGQKHTNKTPVMPDIPTKSYTCMSTSWLLGNVYTAK